MAEEIEFAVPEQNNKLCVNQNGSLEALSPELETIGPCEADARISESKPSLSNSAALLQEEIETLRRQVEGWKELYQSTQELLKDKDAEIAQLLLPAAEARNVPSPVPTAVKPTTELETPATEGKDDTPKPKGKKPKNQQQPNDVRVRHLMKRLRDRSNIPKDPFTEVHDFAMTVDDIWLAAQDEKCVVQPSYDKKLMPELIKLLPRFAREKFNKLDNDLPKKSLDEFSAWLNDIVDEAMGIGGSSDEWETDDDYFDEY